MKKVFALLLAACMLLSCTALAEGTAEPEVNYTYKAATSAFPTNWNPFQYKTASDNDYALNWMTSSLFAFDYNDAMDGYRLEPRMAVGEPEDVTADYVGEEWGIKEGETARAWKYTLRQDLKWNDGTPIDANTYVYSAAQQLDPKMQNYRADSLYSGNVVIHNAEAYVKQGMSITPTMGEKLAELGLTAADEDVAKLLEQVGAEKGYINWANSYGDTYDFENKTWTGDAADSWVETPLTFAELYTFFTTGEGAVYANWADEATKKEWALDELKIANGVYPEISADKIGVLAPSQYELVYILDKPLSGFQLLYQLDTPLVKADLYEACMNESNGIRTNNYGTSVETSASYGPYMMKSFQTDKQIYYVKNPNWYGWNDADNEGLYQTDAIEYTFVSEPATAMEMFLAGQTCSKSLDKDIVDEYVTSEYAYYDEGTSVWAMTFNPNLEALTANQKIAGDNINKTILTLKEFRMAMSLGMDRTAFIAATSPTMKTAFGLYGDLIVADPENAVFYRDNEHAKQTLVNFWGLAEDVGEGKLYADNDEAIDAITGYNPDMAKEYFNQAYDKAIEQGLMDDDDVVQITVGAGSTSSTYQNGYDFIVNNYTALVQGTKLEGKLTFTYDNTLGNGFGDALRTNQVDMLFLVGWTGSAFDPYGLMQVFVDQAYQYDAGVDYTKVDAEITLGDTTYVASMYDWYCIIQGEEMTVSVKDGEKTTLALGYSEDATLAGYRMQVLAEMENVVLQNYNFIPLGGDAGMHLRSMQINYPTEEEVYPMSYGGIKYYTYNYTDAEWAKFVADQGGVLNYK